MKTQEKNSVEQIKVESNSNKKINIWNVIGAILCVILIPILAINCFLIVKGLLKPNEVPSVGKYMPLIVLTESMETKIYAGDLIICKKIDAKDVKEDYIIAFFDPDGNGKTVVTHRVKRVDVEIVDGEEKISFRTEGDNNDIEDRLSVPAENVIGVYTGVRFGMVGHIVLFTQTGPGLLVCIFIPVSLFALYYFLQRRKQAKTNQSNIDSLKAELEMLKSAKQQLENENQALNSVQTPTEENNSDGDITG